MAGQKKAFFINHKHIFLSRFPPFSGKIEFFRRGTFGRQKIEIIMKNWTFFFSDLFALFLRQWLKENRKRACFCVSIAVIWAFELFQSSFLRQKHSFDVYERKSLKRSTDAEDKSIATTQTDKEKRWSWINAANN